MSALRCGTLIALCALATACSAAVDDEPAVPTRTVDKVLLFSIDTLRADYLGVYNPAMDTSPNIDAFAEDAFVFTDAITQATSTLPSHMAMFYSLHTFVHRAYHGTQPTPQVTRPIEVVRDAGFMTAALVGGGQLRPRFGLKPGFKRYKVITTHALHEDDQGRDRLAELFDETDRFLRRFHDENFFLFVHTYEPHYPYDAPQRFEDAYEGRSEELRAATAASVIDGTPPRFQPDLGLPEDAFRAENRRGPYAAEVAYTDHFFGRMMEALRGYGIADDVMVIVVSDHGESLGERGVLGHNSFQYEQLRVPFMIKLPGAAGRVVDDPVGLIDLMPTIFAALGLEPPYDFMGLDLLPLMAGQPSAVPPDRIRISENKARMAVLQAPWKVVFNPDRDNLTTLYNTDADPWDMQNLYSEMPGLADSLRNHYYEYVARNWEMAKLFPHDKAGIGDLNEDVKRELRALGYIR